MAWEIDRVWRWARGELKCDACGQPIKTDAPYLGVGPMHVHGETPADCPVEPLPASA